MQVSHYYFLIRGLRELFFGTLRVTGSWCYAGVTLSFPNQRVKGGVLFIFRTQGNRKLLLCSCLTILGLCNLGMALLDLYRYFLTELEHVQQKLSILRRECSRLLCPSVRPSVMMLWSNKSIGVIYCHRRPVNPSRGYPRNRDIRRIYKFRPKEHNRRRELGDRFPPLSPHRPDVHESRLRHQQHPPPHNLGGLHSSFDHH